MQSQLRARLACASTYILLCASAAGAQVSRPAGGAGEIRGRLVDAASQQPITSGSITLARAGDTTAVAVVPPQRDGAFRFAGVEPGHYSVRARSLGFRPILRENVVITAAAATVDLGAIALTAAATTLEEMSVVAEREDVVIAPDRTSYSTKNMTTVSGGTAIDVLRNVPAVDVDGSNRVSLRGNENVVVQINGRTSPLRGDQLSRFLAQMPASTVKTVEVATNPSAKNDPEGTAGIINIVLNQDAELGLSGGFSIGTGTTGMANVSGNIGRQSGPLTVFVSGSVFRDSRHTNGAIDRDNLTASAPAFVEARQGGSESPRTAGFTFRSEYKLNPRDAVSFDAIATGGRLAVGNASHYTDLDHRQVVLGQLDLLSNLRSRDGWQDYTLGYRRGGAPNTNGLVTELRYSGNQSREETERLSMRFDESLPGGSTSGPHERDVGTRRFPAWTLQSDYTRPFGATTKLETGFKGTHRTTINALDATTLEPASGRFLPEPARTSAFDFRERIGAVYGVLSQQVGRTQLQAGLRLEEASMALSVPTTTGQFDRRYASAFPSAIVSYKFTDTRNAKLSYSRRISRPSPYQLSPIEIRDDQRNVFRGNPELQAEYTDAVEFSLQESRGWGSLQLNPYLRQTAHAVRYLQTVDAAGVTSGTYANVASVSTLGTDLNLTLRRGPMTLVGSGSAVRYASDASNVAGEFSARGLIVNSRGNLSWKFTGSTDAQLAWIWRAPFVIEGGKRGTVAYTALAVRHKLWGEQGGITLRVVDPLNILSYDYHMVSDGMAELSRRQYGQRGLFLTVSRNFGQQLKLRPRQAEPEAPPSRGPGT